MDHRDDSVTSVTLLGRLAVDPTDSRSWTEFVDRYGPHVLRWSRKHGCPESDVEDVLQDVLMKLMNAFRSFRYDPKLRFRNWLATVTRNAVTDLLRKQYRLPATGHDEFIASVQSDPAQNDLLERIQGEFDREIFDRACGIVRSRLEPPTWQAFEMTTLQALSAEETAQRLGLRIGTVYTARSRVLGRIKAEVARFHLELEGAEP